MTEKKKSSTKRAPRKRAKAKTQAQGTDATRRSTAPRSDDAANRNSQHSAGNATKARAPEATRDDHERAALEAKREQPMQPPEPRQPSSPPGLAVIPMHVRWRDLDAFNHVNNSSYLTFLEEARLQWLRTVPGEWFHAHAMPVMAAVELHYRKPIEWPAEVDVQLSCERMGNSSVTIGNRIVDRNDASVVYADGNVVMVWIDPATGASVPLPDAIRAACS
jgi:acyl-CoA thioester hydrolase